MRSRSKQEVSTLDRKREQPLVDEVVERPGHRKRLPGLYSRAAPLKRPHDLDRVERIPARGLADLSNQRPRQDRSEALLDDAMQRDGVERPDLEYGQPASERARQLVDEAARKPGTSSEQNPHGLVAQSPTCVRERGRRRRVEPLHVVDSNDDQPLGSEPAKRAEERHPDRMAVRRRTLDLFEHECTGKRLALDSRQ